jgi:hypothetical protein
LPAEGRRVPLAGLRVRHRGHLVALLLEEADGDVVHGAESRGGHAQLAGVRLRVLEELLRGLERAVALHEQERVRHLRARDPLELVDLVAREPHGQRHQRVLDERGDRVAVGLRSEELRHAGVAGSAGHVRHRQRHAEEGLREVRDLARHGVGAAARAPRADEVDGSARVFLLRDDGHRETEQDQNDRETLHGTSPGTTPELGPVRELR